MIIVKMDIGFKTCTEVSEKLIPKQSWWNRFVNGGKKYENTENQRRFFIVSVYCHCADVGSWKMSQCKKENKIICDWNSLNVGEWFYAEIVSHNEIHVVKLHSRYIKP